MSTYRSEALLALGDPTRLAIFERLVEKPRAVVDLAWGLPVSRPAVSQHLRMLKDVGLVTDEAVGRTRVYRIDPAGLSALRDQLDHYWTTALAGFRTIAEQGNEEER